MKRFPDRGGNIPGASAPGSEASTQWAISNKQCYERTIARHKKGSRMTRRASG